jgi:hypothetical protein
MGIGDWGWGLGIGDWANPQSPNPQPIPQRIIYYFPNLYIFIFYSKIY